MQNILLQGSVRLEGPQVMGFVQLFVQTVKGVLVYELCNSLMPLYRGGSPWINRFGELLMRPDICSAIDRIGSSSSDTSSVIYDISTPRKPEVSLKG